MSNEHQPGSPGAVDELDALHTKCTPGPLRVNRYDDSDCIRYQLQSEATGGDDMDVGRVLGHIDDSDTPRARWDATFFAQASNSWPAISAELRTLRARVAELEGQAKGSLENNYKLQLESAEGWGKYRAEKAERRAAEARVKEFEAAMWTFAAEVESRDRRITDIESQLAAAREEQGLEAKVREVLGERFALLRMGMVGESVDYGWAAMWPSVDDDREWPRLPTQDGRPPLPAERIETLPALLRAILEVEAKGG